MNSSAVYPSPSTLLPKIARTVVSLWSGPSSQLPWSSTQAGRLPLTSQSWCASMVSSVATSETDVPSLSVKVQVELQVPPGVAITAPSTLPVLTIVSVNLTVVTGGLVDLVVLVGGGLAEVPEPGPVVPVLRPVLRVTPPPESLELVDPLSMVVRDVALFVVAVVEPC
jgi:hypothetical protein